MTGALVFCVDKAKGGLFFRVVDLSVSGASPAYWARLSKIDGRRALHT